jgi:hypothetical protein
VRAKGARWAAGTAAVAWLLYFLTAAPDVTWANSSGDGGELITAAVTLGVPHPPGYPTYVLLGKLLSMFPGGEMAFRFNLWSGSAVAVAAGLVAAITHGQLRKPGEQESARQGHVAMAAGLSFAFASLVWGQATVSEVYGLNLAFLAAFLWAALGSRPAWLVGLLLGLSVTTHLTSWLMLPLALILTPARQWIQLGLGLFAGLTPFMALFWLAQGNSPVMWGDASGLSGWWWLVSGRLYSGNVMSLSPSEWWSRWRAWFPLLLGQFTVAGPVLVVAGTCWASQVEARRRLALMATAAIYLLYAMGYDSVDSVVYVLPGLLLMALLLGFGLERLGWLSFGLPLLLLLLNFSAQNLSDDTGIRPRAVRLLEAAPAKAVLLTPGDETIFALWYFQHVERMRSDLILVDSNLFAFDWYRLHLAQQHTELTALAEDDLEQFRHLNERQRPVCLVTLSTHPGDEPSPGSCNGAMP